MPRRVAATAAATSSGQRLEAKATLTADMVAACDSVDGPIDVGVRSACRFASAAATAASRRSAEITAFVSSRAAFTDIDVVGKVAAPAPAPPDLPERLAAPPADPTDAGPAAEADAAADGNATPQLPPATAPKEGGTRPAAAAATAAASPSPPSAPMRLPPQPVNIATSIFISRS